MTRKSPNARCGLFFLLAALILLGGCVRKYTLERAHNEVLVEGAFSIWGQWIKDKGDKFDTRIHIANDSTQPIIVRREDLQCSRGDRWGELDVRGFSSRIKHFVLDPGQRLSIVGVCQLQEPGQGDFRVLLRHVFEARRVRVGRSWKLARGELLATDIEWMVHEADIR